MLTHIHYHATHYTRLTKTRLVHLPTHAPDAKCNYTNKSIGKLSENKANNKETCTRTSASHIHTQKHVGAQMTLLCNLRGQT